MSITKEEAIRRHRLMWSWIQEESLKQERGVSKEEAFDYFGWPKIPNLCWCCRYTAKYTDYSKLLLCEYCPLEWPWPEMTCTKVDNTGLYDIYYNAFLNNDYKMVAKVAKQIAELPARK